MILQNNLRLKLGSQSDFRSVINSKSKRVTKNQAANERPGSQALAPNTAHSSTTGSQMCGHSNSRQEDTFPLEEKTQLPGQEAPSKSIRAHLWGWTGVRWRSTRGHCCQPAARCVCVSGFGCVCAFLVNSWCGQCVDKIPELHMEQLKTALANFVSNRRQNLMINQHKSKLNTHFTWSVYLTSRLTSQLLADWC